MSKDFRTGWLLLMLRDGPGYGYELRRELHRRELDVDRAVMYRTLRVMEQAGLISSSWTSSATGPKRRVYELTEAGHAELERIAEQAREARASHDAFLQAHAERPA